MKLHTWRQVPGFRTDEDLQHFYFLDRRQARSLRA
jgi:hypothetical protein